MAAALCQLQAGAQGRAVRKLFNKRDQAWRPSTDSPSSGQACKGQASEQMGSGRWRPGAAISPLLVDLPPKTAQGPSRALAGTGQRPAEGAKQQRRSPVPSWGICRWASGEGAGEGWRS